MATTKKEPKAESTATAIRMRRSVATSERGYTRGQVYDVDEATAAAWIRSGAAEPATPADET